MRIRRKVSMLVLMLFMLSIVAGCSKEETTVLLSRRETPLKSVLIPNCQGQWQLWEQCR